MCNTQLNAQYPVMHVRLTAREKWWFDYRLYINDGQATVKNLVCEDAYGAVSLLLNHPILVCGWR